MRTAEVLHFHFASLLSLIKDSNMLLGVTLRKEANISIASLQTGKY